MQRYEHYGRPDGGGPAEPVKEEAGGWVRYEDAVAAVAAERARWTASCPGKRHGACNYTATCGSVCNKCGAVA